MDPALEDPTNLQIPAANDPTAGLPAAGADASGGLGTAPSGKAWIINQQTGQPFVQKDKAGNVYWFDTDSTPYLKVPAGQATAAAGTAPKTVPVPASGVLWDQASQTFISPYGKDAKGNPILSGPSTLNPGQTLVSGAGTQLGRNPYYDPQQYAMLAREANRQYQLSIMLAQQKYQQDRDTQKFRQATLTADGEYKTQLLGIQRATLAAQTAVQSRSMGQPFAVQLQDGRTAFVSPNEMVGGVSNDWEKWLGDPNQPMSKPNITGTDQQTLPDIQGVNDALPGPAEPTTAGPAENLTPPSAGSGLEHPIDYDTNWGTQASNSMNIGGWNTPMPPKPSGLENPIDYDTNWGDQATNSMGIGGWGKDAIPGAPQPQDVGALSTLPADNPLSGLSGLTPPDLGGLSGKSAADIAGQLGGLGGSAADILGGHGGPFAPAQPAPSGVMPSGAMPGQFTPGAPDTSNAGRSSNPIGGGMEAYGEGAGPAQWPSFNPMGLWDQLTTPQQNQSTIQELLRRGVPASMFGGGGGDRVGKGQAQMARIGAGPDLGQPLQPPGGGMVPPVPPQDIVGLGHDFGTPTQDEEPFHKGVDFQAVQGVPAISPVAGTVVSVGERGDLGLSVTIQDDKGQVHELNHLSAIGVQEGSQVMPGDLVGKVGSSGNSTGPHLDYRVRGQGGDFANPMSDPSIAGALQGLPDMSGASPDQLGVGEGEDDWGGEQSGEMSDDSGGSGWNAGDQYNQQEADNSWSQVTVGDDGGYSSSTIDPSQYGNYGIPSGDQQQYGVSYENPSQGGGFSSDSPGIDQGTGYTGYDYSNPSNPSNPSASNPLGGNPSPTPSPTPKGVQITQWDPSRYNTMLGGSKELLQMQLSAAAEQQTKQIDANKDLQIRQLDAEYKTAMLSATTQKEMQAIQIAYQDRRDQLEQQTEYKKLEVQQAMAKELEASQERIAGTQARSNVLSTWGRSAAASPWLARLSGRTPTPGDIGSGTGYGTQSVNTQNLLTGGATPGGSYLGYVNPGNGAAPTPQAPIYGGAQQGWQGATSGGGDWPVGRGEGDPNGDPNNWGNADGNRLPYSLFGSGAGEDTTYQIDDPGYTAPSAGDRQAGLAQSEYRPYGMDWSGPSSGGQPAAGQSAPSMPTWSDVGGMQNPQPGGSPGGNWWDQAGQAGWTAPSSWQQPAQGAPDTSGAAGGPGFANNIDDLTQGGEMPAAPSIQDWESLGPFGQASMRYGLESAGYNWAPYSEAMLAGWRQTGQNDPNTGLSGWSAPHVTNLGMQSMSPIQQQGLQQTAELFSPWSDYLNREQRSWQTGARPMTSVRA